MTGTAVAIQRRAPHPSLTGLVAGVVDMAETAPGLVARRQPAGSLLPLVISWEGTLDVRGIAEGEGTGTYSSFLAGPMLGYVDTEFARQQNCVQIYLTPLGAFRLLGIAGAELAGRVVDLEALGTAGAVFGPELRDRLGAESSAAGRLDLVHEALLKAPMAAEPDDFVAWMWHRLAATAGRIAIADLVTGTGWSHRHVVDRFREQVGLTPKAAADLLRSERAIADLGRRPLAEVAHHWGYSDQSHLTRDIKRRTGAPPVAWVKSRQPTVAHALGTADVGLP